MKWLLALLALGLIAAAPARAPCSQPSDYHCAIGHQSELKLRGGISEAQRIIRIPPSALPLERPLTIRFAGLASAEFYWNGRRIGRNGIPGETRSGEVPGAYYATVVVPRALVRPGENVVTARLSGQHLWLPVERPIHILDVGPYETPELPGKSGYLPALLALGAIALAFAYFLAVAFSGGPAGSRLVAGFAVTVLLQLLAEVSRAYISLSYPVALGRVTAIALLAAIAAILIAAYSAQRFMRRSQSLLVTATAGAALASVILIPSFDLKALGALLAGAIAVAAAAVVGIRLHVKGALWAAVFSLVTIASMLWKPFTFLDLSWHVIAACLLLLLVLEQIGQLRRARAEIAKVEQLEERLTKAEAAGEPIVQLKDGSRMHRVAEADILYARGADDYCEVRLADGRDLLVTTGLARFQASLPASFVRVHKSYVVNGRHVTSLEPRPGGGRQIRLGADIAVPVGRSYEKSLATPNDVRPPAARPSPAGG